MLRSAGRWDWYEIPAEWLRAWAQTTGGPVPGVIIRPKGTIEIHRTHLPLLRAAGFDVSNVGDPSVESPPTYGDVELRPWQATGRAWLTPRRGALVADEMRLGKTLMALSMHDFDTGPLMILAPLDVRRVWLRWVERLWPGVNVYCLEGHTIDPDALKAADVVFGHYDIVIKHRLVSFRPGTLIVDEAHLLANKKSKRTEGVRFFSGQAHRVLVLTGTPLWNHVKGLWPLLAMTAPGAWGKDFTFKQRYCAPTMGEYGWRYDGVSNEEEWYLRRQEAVLARTWASERPDLPLPVYRREVVPVDRALTEALDDAAAALASASEQTITTINRYRQILGRVKAAYAVERALARSSRVVVWSWHRSVANFIAKEIRDRDRPAFVIHGQEPVEKRLDTIDEWSVTPGAVLSATLAVGQVGLDLSAAPYTVMAELDWTPVVLSQAAMRIFDPTRGMEVDILGADHPVDSLLADRVVTKLKRSQITKMAAADSGFHMSEEAVDRRDLLAGLDEIVTRTTAKFDRKADDSAGGA